MKENNNKYFIWAIVFVAFCSLLISVKRYNLDGYYQLSSTEECEQGECVYVFSHDFVKEKCDISGCDYSSCIYDENEGNFICQ